MQRAGKQMWFTCDGQMATDTPFLATERLLPYYCFKYGVRGFEFWGLAWWTYNPWQVGWHQFIRQSDEGKKYYWVRYPDGDGFLAYPGKPVGVDGPASTIRLEQIRQGLEDYEALALLSELGSESQTGRTSRFPPPSAPWPWPGTWLQFPTPAGCARPRFCPIRIAFRPSARRSMRRWSS